MINIDPEGYSGGKADAWSCGIILFVLTAGSLPFDHHQIDALFRLILRGHINYPPYFSDSLVDLLSNILNINPEDRYSLSDMTRHPWFNDPVEDAMPVDVYQPPPLPPADPYFQLPNALNPNGFAQPEYAQSQPPQAPHMPNGHAAMPAPENYQDAMQQPSYLAPHHGWNNVDLGVPDYSNTALPGPTDMPLLSSTDQIPAPMLPAAISESGANAATELPEDESSSGADMPEPRFMAPSGTHPLLDRIRSLLYRTEGSVFPSSDEEHEVVEARELRAPNGFFGRRVREANGAVLPDEDVAIRRSYSLGYLPTVPCYDNMNNDTVFPNGDANGQSAMRWRVKRQLWDSAAATWRFPGGSEHIGNTAVFAHDKEGTTSPHYDKDTADQMAKRNSGSMGRSSRDASPSTDSTTSIVAPASRQGLTRSHSHDGTMTALPAGRRSRTRESAASKARAPSSKPKNKNGESRAKTTRTKRKARSNYQERDSDGEMTLEENTGQNHRPGTVRFTEIEQQESHVQQSSHRPDTDWVRTDVEKMIWCRMMRDFERIYDLDEFDTDSATLNEGWTAALGKEDLSRKNSFAATRFGSPTFVRTRSSQYLFSHSLRNWQRTEGEYGYDRTPVPHAVQDHVQAETLSDVPAHGSNEAVSVTSLGAGQSPPLKDASNLYDREGMMSDGRSAEDRDSSSPVSAKKAVSAANMTLAHDVIERAEAYTSEKSGSASSAAVSKHTKSTREGGQSEPRPEGRSHVDSVSSGAMRSGSGASDGMMSTPRDPEKARTEGEGGTNRARGYNYYPSPLCSKVSEDEEYEVSPFALAIPGPKKKLVPSKVPLQGRLPLLNRAKLLLMKTVEPIEAGTKFKAVLDPSRCFDAVQEVLRVYGCSRVHGTITKAHERYRIKCESHRSGTVVAATITLIKHAISNHLTLVIFNRRGKSTEQEFHKFYNEVHSLYCEKWNTVTECTSSGAVEDSK